LFHTQVSDLAWDGGPHRWRIRTNRGDAFTAQYVGMAPGPLHVPKLPGIPGIEDFEGTASTPAAGTTTTRAVIPRARRSTSWPTSASPSSARAPRRAVHPAPGARLQGALRLPAHALLGGRAQQHPHRSRTGSQKIATPGWQKRWLDNFVENQGRGIPSEDLVDDGWTEISRRIREKVFSLPPEQMNPEGMRAAFEDADIEKMEQIRARVDSVVEDADTAQKLKAWYSQLCKRPCFSDEYLPAFNAPNTVLVDTDGKGVEQIDETGLVANGKHYEVDCIIYASGFEFGANFQLKTGFDLKGRGDEMLSEHWANGLRTLHGMHIHGFPNAFMVQMNQAANMVSNIPHNIVDHAKTIAQVVSHAESEGYAEVEPTREAEAAWVDLILTGQGSLVASPDCTPGFWNNEGQGWSKEFRQVQGHPGGAQGFFEHIEKWRETGEFEGLRFTK
jgi:hypothetical protein